MVSGNDYPVSSNCCLLLAIFIGFESASYTFSEGEGVVDAVRLTKINGRITELPYHIRLAVLNPTRNTATVGEDFEFMSELSLTFEPDEQELVIPINIPPDDVLEGTEEFSLIISNVVGSSNIFESVSIISKTTVYITDNTSKSSLVHSSCTF